MASSAVNTLRKCPALWFEDGTIILQAVNDGLSFRVYPGILSAQSSVFQTLFTLPQPDSKSPNTYEGCPLVHLQDTGVDLRHFLSAMFEWSYFSQRAEKGYKGILSILRLSAKYEVTSLRNSAIAVLSEHFPATLLDMDKCAPARSSLHPFQVANVALEAGATILMPSALLKCCSYDLDSLLNGVKIENSSSRYRLCQANLITVLAARSRLAYATRNIVFFFAFYPHDCDGCRNNELCRTKKMKWAQSLERLDGWMDPFSAGIPMKLCERCHTKAITMAKRGRGVVWEALPSIMGLGEEWSEIKKATTT